MAIDPRTTSETDIHRMVDDGAYPKLNAETLMSGRVNELPPIPSIPLITEQVRKLDLSAWPMAEALMSTTKRSRPDIYECLDCGHQFPQEAACPECQSKDMALFMRAPSRAEVALHFSQHASGRELELTELDPDWREHFNGDVDRAWDFYRDAKAHDGVEPRPPRPTVTDNLGSPFDAPEMREAMYGDANFDEDLEQP